MSRHSQRQFSREDAKEGDHFPFSIFHFSFFIFHFSFVIRRTDDSCVKTPYKLTKSLFSSFQ